MQHGDFQTLDTRIDASEASIGNQHQTHAIPAPGIGQLKRFRNPQRFQKASFAPGKPQAVISP